MTPPDKPDLFSQFLKSTQTLPAIQYGKVTVQQVEAWLKPRCATYPPVCTICGNQRWNVAMDIVKAPLFYEQGQNYAYPAVMMYCDRCGNVVLLNAVAMGLVPPAK